MRRLKPGDTLHRRDTEAPAVEAMDLEAPRVRYHHLKRPGGAGCPLALSVPFARPSTGRLAPQNPNSARLGPGFCSDTVLVHPVRDSQD